MLVETSLTGDRSARPTGPAGCAGVLGLRPIPDDPESSSLLGMPSTYRLMSCAHDHVSVVKRLTSRLGLMNGHPAAARGQYLEAATKMHWYVVLNTDLPCEKKINPRQCFQGAAADLTSHDTPVSGHSSRLGTALTCRLSLRSLDSASSCASRVGVTAS